VRFGSVSALSPAYVGRLALLTVLYPDITLSIGSTACMLVLFHCGVDCGAAPGSGTASFPSDPERRNVKLLPMCRVVESLLPAVVSMVSLPPLGLRVESRGTLPRITPSSPSWDLVLCLPGPLRPQIYCWS